MSIYRIKNEIDFEYDTDVYYPKIKLVILSILELKIIIDNNMKYYSDFLFLLRIVISDTYSFYFFLFFFNHFYFLIVSKFK